MVKIQDTGKYRRNIKDQFYTHTEVSKYCIKILQSYISNTSNYLWIEPSAGNGSFLNQIPSIYEKIGIDIEPNAENIQKADFLKWKPPNTNKKIVIIGNPPFGRQSSLAKAFIKKACEYATVIAFILPKSFTKPSMNHVFEKHFHCIHTEDIKRNAFLINNIEYDVPCVFQIWQKKEIERLIEQKIEPNGFEYVKKEDIYHIAFRRVGAHAGKCYLRNEKEYSIQSHYFIQFDNKYISHINTIIEKINNHIFPSNTVGPRSLSKSEVNDVLNQILEGIF
jgi:predicted RNA methylase